MYFALKSLPGFRLMGTPQPVEGISSSSFFAEAGAARGVVALGAGVGSGSALSPPPAVSIEASAGS
jgi:hypothetical protein